MVIVTCCPREPDTLLGTLQSLADAGFHDPVLCHDADKTLGAYGNFKAALRLAGDAESVIVFQDDIEVSRGLRGYCDEILTNPEVWNERTGVVSLYTASRHHSDERWTKLSPCRGNNALGALAVMLPISFAEHFLSDYPGRGSLHRTDFWLAEFCGQHGYDYWMHSPSLVRHTGEQSAITDVWNTPAAKAMAKQTRQCGVFCEDTITLADQ